jgi:hypothetical protein
MPTVPDVYNRRPAANSNLAMLTSVADGLVSATNTVPRFVTPIGRHAQLEAVIAQVRPN